MIEIILLPITLILAGLMATWFMIQSWPLSVCAFVVGLLGFAKEPKMAAGMTMGAAWAVFSHLFHGWAGWSPFWWMIVGGMSAGGIMVVLGHAVRAGIARLNADVGAKL